MVDIKIHYSYTMQVFAAYLKTARKLYTPKIVIYLHLQIP
jgi:hypothetical protein